MAAPFNADIVEALAMAPQIGASTLSATTEPTSTQAGIYLLRATARVSLALVDAGLDPLKANLIGFALEQAQAAEMFLTSGWSLLAKGSISSDQREIYKDLLGEGLAIVGDPGNPAKPNTFKQHRTVYLAQGAQALTAGADSRIRSWQLEAADPGEDLTPGSSAGSVPFAQQPDFEDDADL